MIKDYKTIRQIANPLMIVEQVEGVTYDELCEIELPNGEVRRARSSRLRATEPLFSFLTRLRA